MGNCLVTKLKGVVDNPNLPKFGNLMLQVTEHPGEGICANYAFINIKACQIITHGGYVGTSPADLANQKTVLDIPANAYTIFFISNGTYTIEITEKYTIKHLSRTNENYQQLIVPNDAAKFKYLTELVSFSFAGTGTPEIAALGGSITGKLSDFGNLTKLVDFNINTANRLIGTPSDLIGMAGTLENLNFGSCVGITGNVSEFGPFIHLINMDLYDANVSGSFESLVQGQCAAGRTSCESLYSPGFLRKRSFGNVSGDDSYRQYLSWESASKMCIYAGSVPEIPNATKVYVMGYTDGEIATKTASGGIWEGKEVVKVDA
jgi:hypothetical protein